MSHNYSAYGLQIESELALPELCPGSATPDVVVRRRDSDSQPACPGNEPVVVEAERGHFLYRVAGLATYVVRDGREVSIDAVAGCNEEHLRAYFLGCVLGALLYQRKFLVLHASSVQTPRGAVVFSGQSGDGKSTLAAALMQRGYAMLTDDVTAIEINEGGVAMAQSGIPASRLWTDSAARLQYPMDGAERSRISYEKFILPASKFCSEAQPVHAVYFLTPQPRSDVSIQPIDGADRIAYIANGTYLPSYVAALGTEATHFSRALSLAKSAKFGRIRRPSNAFLLDELADRVLADFAD